MLVLKKPHRIFQRHGMQGQLGRFKQLHDQRGIIDGALDQVPRERWSHSPDAWNDTTLPRRNSAVM